MTQHTRWVVGGRRAPEWHKAKMVHLAASEFTEAEEHAYAFVTLEQPLLLWRSPNASIPTCTEVQTLEPNLTDVIRATWEYYHQRELGKTTALERSTKCPCQARKLQETTPVSAFGELGPMHGDDGLTSCGGGCCTPFPLGHRMTNEEAREL